MDEHVDEHGDERLDEPNPSPARPVAPGGWKRVLIGFAVGLAAGALIALVLPRDDGPRRAG